MFGEVEGIDLQARRLTVNAVGLQDLTARVRKSTEPRRQW